MSALVSVIMPAYNAERFIEEAIGSVLAQTYTNWELLVVNDGSTDKTQDVVDGFTDPRVRQFQQENKGVSAARNLAIMESLGDILCFLDADDVLPPRSIEARMEVFTNNPAATIVDGEVIIKDENLEVTERKFVPAFRGDPTRKYLQLSNDCFFGVSAMVRKVETSTNFFEEDLIYGEDLLYYLQASRGGLYDFTTDTVLVQRRRSDSATASMSAVEKGYRRMYRKLQTYDIATSEELDTFRKRIIKVVFKSYLAKGMVFKAIGSAIRNRDL